MSTHKVEREQPDELRGKYSGCHANNTTQVQRSINNSLERHGLEEARSLPRRVKSANRYGSRMRPEIEEALSIPATIAENNYTTTAKNDTRQRLYMRMIGRFSQKFGNDENTIRVINECLSSKLKNADRIEAKDFDEIQREVKSRLIWERRTGEQSRTQPTAQGSGVNPVRSLSALRSSAHPADEQANQIEDGRLAPDRRAQTKLQHHRSRAQNLIQTDNVRSLDSLSQERERNQQPVAQGRNLPESPALKQMRSQNSKNMQSN